MFQREPRLQHRFPADSCRARGPGAAAIGDFVRVAGEHLHAAHLDAERGRGDLRHDGLRSLSLLGDAGRGDDGPARVQLDGAAVLRGDARTAHAVEHRARVGDFDEGREPDAAVDSLFSEIGLFIAQLFVFHQREELFQALLMRQRLEAHPRRRLAGIGVVGDKVPPPHLGGI